MRALLAVAVVLAPIAGHADPAPAPPGAPAAPVAPAMRGDSAPATAPSAPIDPSPRLELVDRGDAVEIIARHIKAARTAVLPVRSRLEVPIVGTPQAKRVVPSDPTVKLIELPDESTRVLSVKLGFERNDVKALSRFAQAIQVGDDLHLLIPRKLRDDGTAPRLPDPIMPAVAARIDPPAPVLGPSPAPRPASVAPVAPVAPVPTVAAKLDDKPRSDAPAAPAARPRSAAEALAAAPTATTPSPGGAAAATSAPTPSAPQPLDHALVADRDDAWSQISMYGALGLALAGAGVWLLRRRRTRPGQAAAIEIIAQRSLGGKARIVWLSAGAREMIVSVTGQQVRMLGQWRKADAPALPEAHTHAGGELRDAPAAAPTGRLTGSMAVPLPIDKPLSPAVSGLLRLRGRTGQMPAISPDDLPDSVRADELWTKEILAATARPGSRS